MLQRIGPFYLSVGMICVALLSAGCGGAAKGPNSRVSGTVTFNGQPVAAGEVVFIVKGTGFAATVPLSAGKFQMENPIEAGTYAVLVTPLPPPPPDPVNPPPVPKDPTDIPKKYRSEATSTLTATVKTGHNELTFKLE